MSKLVSINIPVYNRADLIGRCISRIREYTEYPNYEIIVADDGSTDKAVQAALRNKVDIVIRHESNMGIAQSRYDAVERSSGEYICAMDNDTIVTPRWLTKLIFAMEEKWTNNYWMGPMVTAALLSCQLGYFLHRQPVNEFGLIEVETVGTACTLIKREVFEKVGNFDPALHNLWSDMDFCKRLHKEKDKFSNCGHAYIPKVVIDPQTLCYHHGWIDRDGKMEEEPGQHTRSLLELNDTKHKWWSLDSMKIIEKRWGVTHPWKDRLQRELNGE